MMLLSWVIGFGITSQRSGWYYSQPYIFYERAIKNELDMVSQRGDWL